MPEPPSVIVAHGLWMTGLEATMFRHRLAHEGFLVRQFHYRSMTASPEAVIAELREAVLALPPPVHLVGHSLGGLVLLRLAQAHPELPYGRFVLLGSPVNGSRSARAFTRLPGAGWFFGHLADRELLREEPHEWRHPAEIGVIAGTQPIGFGRVLGDLPLPNDGTVALDETRLEGATEQLTLPVTHTGMLFNETVVRATVSFLRHGRFAA